MNGYAAAVISSVTLSLITLKNPMCDRARAQSELIELQSANCDMNQRIQKLETEIKALHTNHGLEHAIRDELGYVRKGKNEILIVFEEPP